MNKQLLRLEPVFQEKIWGGERLKTVFNYPVPGDHTGECWAISGHHSGDCAVVGTGKTLGQLWKQQPALFGNVGGEIFPLLVKIIDAKEDLSIQVHPDDAYAATHENGSLGKTECWYVLDCDKDATIIIGHHAQTKAEMEQMIKEGRWNELLREIPIRKGDFFQIDPGCLHAIKGGTLILETQQSSDVTYRFYDYGRLQDGKPRPLHIERSLDVTAIPYRPSDFAVTRQTVQGSTLTHLITCPYYSVYHLKLNGTVKTDWTEPFVNVSIIEGEGFLDDEPVKKGDHLIIPAGYGLMKLQGQMELIYSHL